MELLDQGARFYEVLGYFLAASAFGMLAVGIVWGLRRHIPAPHRLLFSACSVITITIAGFGVFTFLVWSTASAAPHVLPPTQKHMNLPGIVAPGGREDPMVEIRFELLADGSCSLEGVAISATDLKSQLESLADRNSKTVLLVVDEDTRHIQVVEWMDWLAQLDFASVEIQVASAEGETPDLTAVHSTAS